MITDKFVFFVYLCRVIQNNGLMVVVEMILLVYVLYWLFRSLPRIVLVILLLPVAPFMCAWEIRKERPFVAWTIIVLWMMLYAVFALVLI